jgi:hypothetical protein
MKREKDMFAYSPELATYETRIGSMPIKTHKGWGTIEFKQTVCTGWEMPEIKEKEDG